MFVLSFEILLYRLNLTLCLLLNCMDVFPILKIHFGTSLRDPVVGNQPAKAGDTSLIPSPGRFHMSRMQLNPCTTATEPEF